MKTNGSKIAKWMQWLENKPWKQQLSIPFKPEKLICVCMCTCIGEGNGCESHVFSNTQELLGQNSLAVYNYKVTADDDCSHEIKRHLLLGRKAMINLDSVLKNKDIILMTKFHLVKAMVFPVVMYRCESWTIKKAEHWRIDAFQVWCWRRLLRVFWTAWRSNKSILKEINPEYSLGRTDAETEAPILWPPDVKSWLIWKDPDAGKDWEQEKGMTEDEMVGWHHRLNGHQCEQTAGDSEGQGSLACCSPWGCRVGHNLTTKHK